MSKAVTISLAVFSAALLAVCIRLAARRPEERVVEVERTRVETVTEVRIDTFTVTRVVEVERRVVDTVYLESRTPVPISEYRFHEEGRYDITATGFDVSLSSLTLYPKTTTNTIVETVERRVPVRQWDIYFGANLSYLGDKVTPSITATVKTPKKWLFGANMGISAGSLTYGVSVQRKLTHNK